MASKTDKPDEIASTPDLVQLKELYEMMVKEGLDILELKNEEGRIHLNRRLASQPIHTPQLKAPRMVSSAEEEPNDPGVGQDAIKAPLSGVFYRANSPTRPPFTKEGDVVEPGQTLCIIEAMKVMNEIKAEKRCRIVKITAENSRPVTVEQDLFWIETA